MLIIYYGNTRKVLSRYLSHYKKSVENMLSLPIAKIENMLVDYLLDLKKQDLSSSYINLNFCALKHFYFMNDVRINKEKIGKFLGEPKKKNVDRSYTHSEIKNLLDIADITVQSYNFRTGFNRCPYRFSKFEIIPFRNER